MVSASTLKGLRFYQILGLVGLIVVFGSIGAWAAMTSIRGAVIASGVIVVEGYSKRIQSRDGGIVAEIKVADGDRVKAGDLLIRLDETETRAGLAIIEALLDEFEAKRARLTAERDGKGEVRFPTALMARRDSARVAELLTGEERLFASQRAVLAGSKDQLDQRIDQLEQEIAGLTAQATATIEQSRLIGGELESLQPLLKNGSLRSPGSGVSSASRRGSSAISASARPRSRVPRPASARPASISSSSPTMPAAPRSRTSARRKAALPSCRSAGSKPRPSFRAPRCAPPSMASSMSSRSTPSAA